MFLLLLLLTVIAALVCANWAANMGRGTTISGLRFAFYFWSSVGAGLAGLALAVLGYYIHVSPNTVCLVPIGFCVSLGGAFLFAKLRR